MRGCRGIFGSFLDSILYNIRGCLGIFGSLLDSILYYTAGCRGVFGTLLDSTGLLDSILQNVGGVGVSLGVCWIVFCTFCTIGVGGCLKSKFATKY